MCFVKHEMRQTFRNMLNYFKLFVRKIKREKIFSFINILGLSLGIACSLLIYLYIESELSHDKFHANADRLYRINQTFIWGDNVTDQFSSTGPGVALALREELPEAEIITRVHTPGGYLVTNKIGEEIISFDENNIFAADSNFLEAFTFPLKFGDPKTALFKPQSILITEETAAKYFSDENPIGQTLQLGRGGNVVNYEVTGVFKPIPENSYIEFDFLLSMSSFPRVAGQEWTWIWTTFETFVLLNENSDINHISEKLLNVPATHAETTLQRIMGTSFEDYVKSGKEWKLYIQPYTDIHLGSANVFNRLNATGNRTVVNVLVGTGLLILLLSCINYVNLKTSQITKYAKDTGVRKMLGSSKTRIGKQYLIESLLFVILSIVLGTLITFYTLPFFNQVSGKEINPLILIEPALIGYLLILALTMSLLSGSYPALLLSAFKPIDVLNGRVNSGGKANSIRNLFVIIQFSISMALIAATAIVYEQLQFTFNKDIGFQKENLLVVNNLEWLDGRQSFVEELKNISGVIGSSLNSSMPPGLSDGDQFLPEEDQNRNVPLNYAKVDESYIPTLGIELLHGRNFSETVEREKYTVIINEAAARSMGWEASEEVLQKRIIYPGSPEPYTIIGIVKDFNYWSLQSGIEPMALFHIDSPGLGSYGGFFAGVRVESTGTANTLAQIESLWKSKNAGVAFSFNFIDDAFAESFQSTEQFRKSLSVFAGLALFIAGLGLLGMIIYVIEQRTKEIGIRKVLGSSTIQVVLLMSRKFVLQVIIALIISIPVTYWAMSKWLLDFQYRINISPMIFILAGVIATLFAFSIVGFHSYRAAQMNPAKALKDE
jgi:putative ABC transport system permease protein